MASYTEEQKINYVILLQIRYAGQCDTMAKAMDISRQSLRTWREEYGKFATQIIDKSIKPTVDKPAKDEVPEIEDIINEGLIRLAKMIKTSDDAGTITAALCRLFEIRKMQKETGGNETEKMYEEINAILYGKEK